MDDGRVTRVVESVAGPVMAAAGVDARTPATSTACSCCRRTRTGMRVVPRGAAGGWCRTARRGAQRHERPALAVGQVDFALGAAGSGWWTTCVARSTPTGGRWRSRARGRRQVAAAADLVKGKAAAVPVALVRGWRVRDRCGERDGGRALVRTGPGTGSRQARRRRSVRPWGSRPVPSWPNASGSRASVWRHRRYEWAERSPSRCRPRTSTRVGVDVGLDEVVVTVTGRPRHAGRRIRCVVGEGFATSVDAAATARRRGAGSIRER
jgi:coenzyme F420-0:L-glutamate ligase/coenzyme F420-1:gamma-L-glutamate ligase